MWFFLLLDYAPDECIISVFISCFVLSFSHSTQGSRCCWAHEYRDLHQKTRWCRENRCQSWVLWRGRQAKARWAIYLHCGRCGRYLPSSKRIKAWQPRIREQTKGYRPAGGLLIPLARVILQFASTAFCCNLPFLLYFPSVCFCFFLSFFFLLFAFVQLFFVVFGSGFFFPTLFLMFGLSFCLSLFWSFLFDIYLLFYFLTFFY